MDYCRDVDGSGRGCRSHLTRCTAGCLLAPDPILILASTYFPPHGLPRTVRTPAAAAVAVASALRTTLLSRRFQSQKLFMATLVAAQARLLCRTRWIHSGRWRHLIQVSVL